MTTPLGYIKNMQNRYNKPYSKVYIHTWGCQMNEHQSEIIAGMLNSCGYQITDDLKDADIIIFNTCIVRQKPENKVYSEIGIVKKLKEENPHILLGIGGCMAQVRREELFEKSRAVDFVFGTSKIEEVPRLIEEARKRKTGKLKAIEEVPTSLNNLPSLRKSSFQATVTITEGCSNSCSFCIVPRARGPLRSRPMEEIVKEVAELAQKGYQEVILLGQNVNAYGKDLDEVSFGRLLERISKIDIPRIRFTSPHPKDFTASAIEVISKSENICNHLHLPVQAGSDRTLTNMNRGYTREQFIKLVNNIKEKIKDVNITTDIIVGYPGETKKDFRQTVDLMKRVRFGGSYLFKYCPREHTKSFYREDDVPEEEKQRRLEKLLDLQREINKKDNQQKLGKVVKVLVEGHSRNGNQKLYGKSQDMKTVSVRGEEKLVGKIVTTRIKATSPGTLEGEIIENSHEKN